MMMTSPSFYRTIHKENPSGAKKWKVVLAKVLKRHAVKLTVSMLVFILLFTSFLMIGTDASGNGPAAASPAEQIVTVSSGDTLWDIAKRYVEGKDDTRFVIYMIKKRNELKDANIKPGQKLIIPSI
ncbi:LysM peptidoglycan-binding domain-containing protein [Paenibacillus sp. N4]|uniref:cell division suppressor protein YneA n=1 Tax=Paenibacillus vietnamensis TaxID=2590547 RepID=UPI001CD0F72B|nr:LysM peptidoglycan-binding domain-containing protein [Paenibacillus vietnamensis]MCA0757946.1 LysM peptidoglycan-binding domain-containing protein [Paenibacillus vietnamensis]